MTEIQYEGSGSQAALLGTKVTESFTSSGGGGDTPESATNGNVVSLVHKVDKVRHEISKLNQLIISHQGRLEDVPDEWEWMANVLERLFLITFTVACLVLSGSILLIGWLAEQRKSH